MRRALHPGTALLLAATCAAPAAAMPAARVFDTRTAPGFGDPRPALRTYLARARPRRAGTQHFCVVGYRFPAGDREAWVHWREGRRLILWDGGDPDHPAGLVGWRRRDLDLARDVVATEAQIGGSSYLVTRAWANGVIADCARGGATYAVAAPRRSATGPGTGVAVRRTVAGNTFHREGR